MKITVIGATGRTGRHVLRQGILRGHKITASTRRPEELADFQGLQKVIKADGRNFSDMVKVVSGQDAIISIAGSGVVDTTRHLITAMEKEKIHRLVLISSHTLVATKPWLAVKVMKWLLRSAYNDLTVAEKMVAESMLDWTIVRATALNNRPAGGHYRRAEGGSDFGSGPYQISREDYARALLDIVENNVDVGVAVEVSGGKKS